MDTYDGRDLQKILKCNTIGIVDIILDEKTNCLKIRSNGKEVETEYHKVEYKELKNIDIKNKWRFDWKEFYRNGYNIYSLNVKNNCDIQGLISFKIDKINQAVYISYVESAPSNIGKEGYYMGVGQHLFAIAIKFSIENGFDGFVYFDAKTRLIKHYETYMNAKQIGTSQRMFINCKNAKKLYNIYFGGGNNNE